MVSGWKRKMLKVLLFIHLLLVPSTILFWGKGYVSLAHHMHQGVLYEITALLAPYQWHRQTRIPGWVEFDLFPFDTSVLHVRVHDSAEPMLRDLLIIWQGTLEENLRTLLQPPEAVNSLVWVEGVERSGNKEPTLIAWSTVDVTGRWMRPPDKPGQGLPPIHGAAEFSQRIYNLGRLWLVFYSFRDSSGEQLVPAVPKLPNGPIRIIDTTTTRQVAFISRLGSLHRVPWGWEGERLTSIDILERIRPYRPGVMPIGYRLGILHARLSRGDILWGLPHPPGGSGIWEYCWMILYPLGMAATPYRYLAYLPLMVVPRVLVWPVAVLWGMLLLASWVWGVVVYQRWPKPER